VRLLAIGLLVLGVSSCDTEPTMPPAEVGISGTYTAVWCYVGSGGSAPPCTTFQSGTNQARLDSARAVFSRDGSVTWKAAYWSRSCVFISGSCQETITRSYENAAGTYAITGTGVTLSLTEGSRSWTMAFAATIPTEVRSSWAGPDTLRAGFSSQASSVVAFAPSQQP
jgi:hypothetical protein